MTDPGWHPDPFGRAGRRYHDGSRWTEHVADDGGNQSIDPPGPGPAPAAEAATTAGPAAAVDPGTSAVDPGAGADAGGGQGGGRGDQPPATPGIVIGAPPPRARRGEATAAAAASRPPAADAAPRAPAAPASPAAPATPAARRDDGDDLDAEPTQAVSAVRREPSLTKPAAPPPAAAAGPRVEPTAPPVDAAPVDAPPSPATGDQATTVIPADVAAAVARSAAVTGPIPGDRISADSSSLGPMPSTDGGDQTTVIPVMGLDAVAAAVAQGAPPTGQRSQGPAPVPRPRGGLNVIGLVLALLGLLLGLVSVLLLPWGGGGGTPGYLDVRTSVDELGPPIGAIPTSLMLSGGLFAVVAAGLVALARAVGKRGLAIVALVGVAIAFLGLSALGVLAVDVRSEDIPGLPQVAPTVPENQEPGSPATDPATGAPPTVPGGAAVTDPLTGAPPTVPDQGQSAEDQADSVAADVEDFVEDAERNLIGGAIVAFAAMFLATVLVGVGLVRSPDGNALMAFAGLALTTAWVIVGTVQLGGPDGIGDLGIGPWVLAAGSVLMALSTLVPRTGGRRPR